ncbi:MAG: hypothetical protein K8T91_15210 [Planctomycetes bacterium]|nr:hypothetical protein [Planctomycetota bacterium]
MPRAPQEDFVAVDHDSFLDIVANIVGILVILVMIVGVRARSVPSPKPASTPSAASASLAEPLAMAGALEQSVLQLRGDAIQVAQTRQQREMERQYIATLKHSAEQELNKRREALTTEQREEFDAKRRLGYARAKLESLDRQRIQLAGAETTNVVEVKNYPTPLGRTVFGREVHFQLLNDRVTWLPVDELIEDAKGEARQKVWKLDGLPESTEVVGPREGFRLRYTLEKIDIPAAERDATGRGGYIIRSKKWELIPAQSNLGEAMEAALTPQSQFNAVLSRFDPKQTTVTLWTYPESFGSFRQLKEELYRRGFATAGRPLPEGMPIGGSPNGTRSSAQ